MKTLRQGRRNLLPQAHACPMMLSVYEADGPGPAENEILHRETLQILL